MAVDFDGDDDYILFSNITQSDNLPKITLTAWINLDAPPVPVATDVILAKPSEISLSIGPDNYLGFLTLTSDTAGYWFTENNSIGTGNYYNVAVTMDRSSNSNNPNIYVNGIKKTATRYQEPTGTMVTTSGGSVLVTYSGLNSINGKMQDLRIYNRILSDAEILDIYNSKCQINNDYGLVFHAPLNEYGNNFHDRISGIIGKITGNLTSVADTLQLIGGQ